MNYSFTGASISPDVKTISIRSFPDQQGKGPGMLSNTFTEDLKNKFASQTKLNLVESVGDIHLEGSITDYSIRPMGIQGNETASLNRLTISVFVKFINAKNEKQNFEMSFSRYADYDSKLIITTIENDLIKEIDNQLVDDIFNRAVANW